MKAQDLLNEHGYNGQELLMNPYTGSVDRAINWAQEACDWEGDIQEQFSSLVEVNECE